MLNPALLDRYQDMERYQETAKYPRRLPRSGSRWDQTVAKGTYAIQVSFHLPFAKRIPADAIQERRSPIEITIDRLIEETDLLSSISAIKKNPIFVKLANGGEAVLDAVLGRLARGQHNIPFFTLLRTISGEDPVSPEHRGFVGEMAFAWLIWAKGHKKGPYRS